MSKLDLTEQHARERAGFAAPVPISISRDDTRDPADHRMLYVLGFGIAGAIVTCAWSSDRRANRVRPSITGMLKKPPDAPSALSRLRPLRWFCNRPSAGSWG
jgi:hypothetical protein